MEEMENGVFILWKDPSFVGGGGKEPLKERADKLDEREEKQCNKQVSGKLKEEIDCSQGIRGGQQERGQDFPGGPVVPLCFHCSRCRLNPWSGRSPHVAECGRR